MAKVANFQGGLNIRQEPSLLALNEAVEFVNIDNTSTILKSVRSPLHLFSVDTADVGLDNTNILQLDAASGTQQTLALNPSQNTVEYQGITYISNNSGGARPTKVYPNHIASGQYVPVYDTTYSAQFYQIDPSNLAVVNLRILKDRTVFRPGAVINPGNPNNVDFRELIPDSQFIGPLENTGLRLPESYPERLGEHTITGRYCSFSLDGRLQWLTDSGYIDGYYDIESNSISNIQEHSFTTVLRVQAENSEPSVAVYYTRLRPGIVKSAGLVFSPTTIVSPFITLTPRQFHYEQNLLFSTSSDRAVPDSETNPLITSVPIQIPLIQQFGTERPATKVFDIFSIRLISSVEPPTNADGTPANPSLFSLLGTVFLAEYNPLKIPDGSNSYNTDIDNDNGRQTNPESTVRYAIGTFVRSTDPDGNLDSVTTPNANIKIKFDALITAPTETNNPTTADGDSIFPFTSSILRRGEYGVMPHDSVIPGQGIDPDRCYYWFRTNFSNDVNLPEDQRRVSYIVIGPRNPAQGDFTRHMTTSFRTLLRNPGAEAGWEEDFLPLTNSPSFGAVVESDSRIQEVFNLTDYITDNNDLSDPQPLGLTGPTESLTSGENISGELASVDQYTFPTNFQLVVRSNYNQVFRRDSGEGSTVPSSPFPSFNMPIDTEFNLRLRIVGLDADPNSDVITSRDYTVNLTDDGLYNITPPARCRRKGSIFTRRTECSRSETRHARVGLRISLSDYVTHPIEVLIRNDSSEDEDYRRIGVINPGATLRSGNFINITNPSNYEANVDHTQTVDFTALPAAEAGTAPSGTCSVRYTYTYYDSLRDIESPPAPASTLIELNRGHPVEIENIPPSSEEHADVIRIYRICPELGETAFTLVGETVIRPNESFLNTPIPGSFVDELGPADLGGLIEDSNGNLVSRVTESDSTVTETIIVNADGTLADGISENDDRYQRYLNATGAILITQRNTPPPAGVSYLLISNQTRGAMFGIDGNRVRWSVLGQYDYWPATNFVNFSDRVTGILESQEGLLVFTLNQTFLITGQLGTSNIVVNLISRDRGCIDAKSCLHLKSIPIWLSSEGLTTYHNGRTDVISKEKLGDINFEGSIINCVVHNEVYYILYEASTSRGPIESLQTLYPSYTLNSDGSNRNLLLGYDSRYTGSFTVYEIPNLVYVNTVQNRTSLFGMIREGDAINVTTLFNGIDELPVSYKGPVITGGAYARVKNYDKLYIRHDGTFTFSYDLYAVRDNANKSETRELTNGSDIDRSIQAKVAPNSFYGMQVSITGSGEFNEYEWTSSSSKTQKSGASTP